MNRRERRLADQRRRAIQRVTERNTHLIVASFDSTCLECDQPIEAGELVQWRPDRPQIHDRCSR